MHKLLIIIIGGRRDRRRGGTALLRVRIRAHSRPFWVRALLLGVWHRRSNNPSIVWWRGGAAGLRRCSKYSGPNVASNPLLSPLVRARLSSERVAAFALSASAKNLVTKLHHLGSLLDAHSCTMPALALGTMAARPSVASCTTISLFFRLPQSTSPSALSLTSFLYGRCISKLQWRHLFLLFHQERGQPPHTLAQCAED